MRAVAHHGIRIGRIRAYRRRLTAVLLALATVLVGALTAVILDNQGWLDFGDTTWWIVLPGALALLAAVIGAWLAPGAVSTLAVAGTSAWTGVAVTMKMAQDRPAWWVPVLITAFGAVWLAATPRLLRPPQLCESLGMAWLLLFLGPAALADLTDPSMGATDDQVVLLACSGLLLALRRRSDRAPTA